jgi:hypothetical protein
VRVVELALRMVPGRRGELAGGFERAGHTFFLIRQQGDQGPGFVSRDTYNHDKVLATDMDESGMAKVKLRCCLCSLLL